MFAHDLDYSNLQAVDVDVWMLLTFPREDEYLFVARRHLC